MENNYEVVATLGREHFFDKMSAKEKAHKTECCGHLIERHVLNKNDEDDWQLIENHCQEYLQKYPKAETISPICCGECGRLIEYKIKLSEKKTW